MEKSFKAALKAAARRFDYGLVLSSSCSAITGRSRIRLLLIDGEHAPNNVQTVLPATGDCALPQPAGGTSVVERSGKSNNG